MQDTSWRFLLNGESAWEAMLADVREAKVSIDCEQYIWNDDKIGREFARVFIEKAKAGVAVRLLVDSVGSVFFSVSSLRAEMDAAGVLVLVFNPVSPWRIYNFSSWFFRTHRKILVVDGVVGYTGGVGMNSNMRTWRDTQVRITGDVLHEMRHAFEHMWQNAKLGKFRRFPKPPAQATQFRFLTNSPHIRQRFFYYTLVNAMRLARECIYLTTPYFIPDHRLLRILRLAALRNVDVRVLVPGGSDSRIVDIATSFYFEKLLKAGIHLYRYQKNVLHAKTAVIDDTWGTVGSTNLDNQSLRFNYEGNLVGLDRHFVEDVKNQFIEDLKSSEELTRAVWSKRSFFDRFKERALRPIHGLL